MTTEQDRTVLISGVSRGLGRALALEFAARGWRVVGFGRNEADVAALRAELGALHLIGVADVRDSGSLAAFLGPLLPRLARLDLVVNNAGVINRNAPLWEVPEAEFTQVMDVNVAGIHRMVRLVVPELLRRGAGVLVNMSSGWGRSTAPEVAPYCASKWAVEALSKALAEELPAGVACVSLNPGVIDTAMLRSCFGEAGAARCPTPAQWAKRAVPFLARLTAADNGRALTVP
jgi:NAD(P)-dependent dehydrogenase (short-subunit alcohol dehydrogenase family)